MGSFFEISPIETVFYLENNEIEGIDSQIVNLYKDKHLKLNSITPDELKQKQD